jgi:signal transduction histidine kinase
MTLTNLSVTLAHWCQTNGLYAKQTFVSLFSCLLRMVREHRMTGLIVTHLDEGFNGITDCLGAVPGIDYTPLAPTDFPPQDSQAPPGMVFILTDRLCCFLHWRPDGQPALDLFNGGWTFHPAEVRSLAESVFAHLRNAALSGQLTQQLANTQLDRRYDDRMSMVIPALVQGLELRNRELTHALAEVRQLHERMVHAERLAAIGQVSATIAHEIRNPLGLMDLYGKLAESQVLQSSCSEAEKHAILTHIGHIQTATCNLESFLGELTDYSKPLQLAHATHYLPDVVNQVVAFCQPLAHKHRIIVQVNNPPATAKPFLNQPCDANRLQQALLNIIKNALEATPDGGTVTLTFSYRKADQAICIKVADQGPGVTQHEQTRLFTPFYTTKLQGTGLGLARSQKIMEAHGGRVQLLTSNAKGSTFALVLPCHA